MDLVLTVVGAIVIALISGVVAVGIARTRQDVAIRVQPPMGLHRKVDRLAKETDERLDALEQTAGALAGVLQHHLEDKAKHGQQPGFRQGEYL